MRVLFAASECVPFVKTGGLADVVGALPAALAAEGVEVRVLLPGYGPVMAALEGAATLGPIETPGGPARLVVGRAAGLDVVALDAPALFDRPGGPYSDTAGRDWPDNHLRFAALSHAAAALAQGADRDWRPDVLHLHDWQTGLAPVYLHQRTGPRPATVLTIHNVAFQGLFPASVIGPLGLDRSGFAQDGYEFWGKVGFLKGALVHADRITTVSPTYARELMTPEFGMGLDGLLRHRRTVVSGILNGIDTRAWDPETDPALPRPYSARAMAGKAAARRALERRLGLAAGMPGPLLAVVSRLTEQKGLDLLAEVLPRFLARGGRLALLGTGATGLEAAFRAQAEADPDRVAVVIGFDEALAHLIFGGADAICIPSRFEPCGLTQLYGLRYGCLPVVARTGGLADTVIDANPAALATGVATGIQFAPVTAAALGDALDRLCDLWADRPAWRRTMRRAMGQPVGWEVSAAAYRALYDGLAG
ncbi:glycogen synthase GlgA [Limibaculum sp. M0105]|uniref:Glycogen synthase n=1 Tax=Thermohalobaculum xanthum TaxID=2753746 RepID=A0A8J7M3V8_9RHOB|nr:glycogen synthase GlgA [Thermohalobaculum xanthum]MBK0397840.1 glycogen synthase GlgA [Thermohalobaculum xanthum]